jgi:hypothetical protein
MKPDWLYFEVTDSGIGIQKSKIDTIFNKFNQVIAKKSGHARSTGLGLTFCKMAVEAHNGEITVSSVPDKETTFRFNLPLVSVKEADIEENAIMLDHALDLNLENSDVEYLSAYVSDLSQIEVYDISNLRKILRNIDDQTSPNILKWKEELNKAIYNCNPEQYQRILDIEHLKNSK